MGNLFLVLIIAFYLQNCFLHSVSIESKIGMQKYSQSIIQSKKLKSIPVKVNFGRTKEERFPIILIANKVYKEDRLEDRSYCSTERTIHSGYDNSNREIYKCNMEKKLKNNYFTEEYFSKFQRSNFFDLANNSNLRIEINAYPGKDGNQIASFLLFFYSLGIIPFQAYTYGTIRFDIYDSKKKEKIKSFQYDIEHRFYEGSLTPLLGVILPIFSERFDQSQNFSTFAIARVAFNEFEEDFIKDFNSDENLQKAAYLHTPPIYKIQIPSKEDFEKNPNLPYLLARLESKLLQRGVELIKQENNPNNSDSIAKADRVLNVNLISLQVGSVTLNISCWDRKNNQEAWTENISLPIKSISNENEIDNAIDKLLSNLASKGEIN